MKSEKLKKTNNETVNFLFDPKELDVVNDNNKNIIIILVQDLNFLNWILKYKKI
jgi:hypothetical protein